MRQLQKFCDWILTGLLCINCMDVVREGVKAQIYASAHFRLFWQDQHWFIWKWHAVGHCCCHTVRTLIQEWLFFRFCLPFQLKVATTGKYHTTVNTLITLILTKVSCFETSYTSITAERNKQAWLQKMKLRLACATTKENNSHSCQSFT